MSLSHCKWVCSVAFEVNHAVTLDLYSNIYIAFIKPLYAFREGGWYKL